MKLLIVFQDGTINQHAPLKPLSRKPKRLKSKPWITKGIHMSIRKRHSLFKSHFLNGEDSEKSTNQEYSNKLIKIIAMSKKFYFTNQLDLNKNNSQKT